MSLLKILFIFLLVSGCSSRYASLDKCLNSCINDRTFMGWPESEAEVHCETMMYISRCCVDDGMLFLPHYVFTGDCDN